MLLNTPGFCNNLSLGPQCPIVTELRTLKRKKAGCMMQTGTHARKQAYTQSHRNTHVMV